MAWTEKLQQTKLAIGENPRLQIVFDSSDPAPEAFIASLKERHAFVPEAYLSFLRQTDGAQIWMYVLAGSGDSSFPSIEQLIERWQPSLGSGSILPIGEDPAGRCLAITADGSVIVIDYKMDTPDEALTIAESFDEFLDSVLMGDKYPSLFGGEPTADHENEWTEFLRDKGWLSSNWAD